MRKKNVSTHSLNFGSKIGLPKKKKALHKNSNNKYLLRVFLAGLPLEQSLRQGLGCGQYDGR